MKYLEVGKIVSTHGIKGEVKVKSSTNFSDERYQIGNKLYIEFQNEMVEIIINSHRVHQGMDLITFNDIININDCLKYVGCTIYVDKDTLEELDEDEFYVDDLIGMNACLENEELIGEIVDVNEVPQGEILVIKKADGNMSMVPFVKEFIKDVLIEENKVIITPIEGLL